jgi:hypothetical protein
MKFKETKWGKWVLGTIGALVAGGAIMLGGVVVGYPAISQLVGLAVAQSATIWNNVIDAAKGDGLSSGILGQSTYLWNGLTFDRVKGTNGSMNVALIGGITPADAYVNPTTASQVWNLNGVFNGTTWDRMRSATGDAMVSTGMTAVGNMVFNGTNFDRERAVTQDALTQTGIQAAGNVTYNGATWDRWRAQVSNVQGGSPTGTLFNASTTSAADTAVVVTIAASANTRAHVYGFDAFCSVGTSNVTITDGGTTIWKTPAVEITTVRTAVAFPVALTGATNSAVVITLATCGGGNTGTLMTQADRF